MDLLDIAIAKKLAEGGGGGSEPTSYNDLSNLPQINGNTLAGDKTASSLGLQDEIDSDNKLSSDLVDDTNATNKFVTEKQKNTWNGKQNTIDSDHKLSSSLVNFSNAEAAALASGIDSSKVGQISTNQTNILYALGKTGRNQFNIDMTTLKYWNTGGTWNENVYTQNGLTFTFNNDGTIDVSGTATGRTNIVLDVYYPLNTEDGYRFNDLDGFVLSGCPTGGAWNRYSLSLQMTDSPWASAAQDTGSGAIIDKSVLPSNVTTVAFYLSIYASYPTSSLTFKPMFCTQEDWSIAHDYTPYRGAPNSDLTYLEAQDRAALAEEIDAGAKNIANIPSTQTISSITFTKDSNEWITSTSTNDTRAWNASNRNVSYSVKAGTYIVYAEAPSTNTGNAKAYVFRNDTPEIALDVSPGQSKYIEITFTSASNIGIEYKTNQNKVRYMICTKAAFGVSNKFVPYCKSNYQLTIDIGNVNAVLEAVL